MIADDFAYYFAQGDSSVVELFRRELANLDAKKSRAFMKSLDWQMFLREYYDGASFDMKDVHAFIDFARSHLM